jgi:hypothetical protein
MAYDSLPDAIAIVYKLVNACIAGYDFIIWQRFK